MEGGDISVSNVDERIVSMKFDNSEFEAGATKAIDILDKLKDTLKFDGAESGVENLKKSLSGFDTNGVSSSLDTVKGGFSALEQVGIGALRRLGEEVANLGMKLLRDLGNNLTKGARDGFGEYQMMMNSIQTISANSGEEMSVIKENLDELNTYADKTIYVFSEMTANIGRFTAAGIDVKTSTNAIKGFSNMAALAGAGSQETARGMYQLSQAMAAGVVKLQDWRSIQNASIDTAAFKDILIETARAMDMPVDQAIKKQGSFTASLSEGWLTADVMSQALQVATMSTRDFADEEEGMAQRMKELSAMGYSEDVAKKLIGIANAADDSAREVRTFQQLMDTVEEAIGSGWAETWELIVGDFDQATELFTTLSQTFDKIIGASANARNAFFKRWADKGGRDALIGAFANVFEGLTRIFVPLRDAFSEVFSFSGEQLAVLTENFALFTQRLVISEDVMTKLHDIFQSVFTIVHSIFGIIGNGFRFVFGYFGLFFNGFNSVESILLSVNDLLGPIAEWFNNLHASTDAAVTSFLDMAHTVTNLRDVWNAFDAGVEGISKDTLVKSLESPLKRIVELGRDVHRIIKNVFDVFVGLLKVGASIGKLVWSLSAPIRDIIKIVGGVLVFTIIPKLVSALAAISTVIKDITTALSSRMSSVINSVAGIFSGAYEIVRNFASAIWSVLNENSIVKTLSGYFSGIVSFFSGFLSGFASYGKSFGDTIDKHIIEPLNNFKTSVSEFSSNHKVDFFKSWFESVGESIAKFKNKAIAKIPAPIKKAAAAIKSFFVQVKNFVVNTKIFKQIKTALSGFVGKDTFDFIDVLSRLKDAIVSNFGKIKTYLADFSIVKALSDLQNKFSEFFGQFGINLPDFGTAITDKLGTIKDYFSGLFSADESGKLFGGALENLPATFRSLFDQIAGSFEYGKKNIQREAGQLSLDNVATNVINMTEGIAGVPAILENIVTRIADSITNFLSMFKMPTIEELLSGGLIVTFIGFARSLKNVNTSLSGVIDGFVKWPDKLGTALRQIGEGFNSWRKETKADAILKIAAGIAIIAGALFILASIPSDDLIRAGKAMGIIAASMVGILTVFSLLERLPNAAGLTTSMLNLGMAIQGFGIGVAAFAVACLIIAAIPTDQLENSIDVVTTIAISLAIMSAAIGQNGKSVAKGAKSFIIMAIGIWAMAKAIEAIGKLDMTAIEAAMPIFVGIMLTLSVFGAVGAKGLAEIMRVMPKFAIGVAVFAVAIVILAASLQMASDYLDGITNDITGLFVLAGALVAFVAVCKFLQDANPIETAAGILIFAAALAVIAASVSMLGSIQDMESTLDALKLIGIMLIGFAAATYNLNASDMMATGAAIAVFAGAIGILTMAMMAISGIENMDQALKGLGAMAAMIAEMAIITKISGGFSLLMTGVAMIAFAAAVGILAIALQQFEKVNSKSLATALVAVVAGFAVLGAAAFILAPLSPVLLTLSTAFLIFAAAVGVISVSIWLLTDALLSLEGYDAATIASKLGGLGTGLGSMLLNIFKSAFESIYNWFVENRQVFAQYFVGAVNFVGEKLGEIGSWLVANAPSMFSGFVDWAKTNIPIIAQNIGNAFGQIVTAMGPIAESIGKVALDAKDRFLAYLKSDEFKAKAEEIKTWFLDSLGKLVDKVKEIAVDVISGFVKGISEHVSELITSAQEMVNSWIDAVRGFLDSNSPSRVMADIGHDVVQGLIDGIGELIGNLGAKAGEIGTAIVNGVGNFVGGLATKAKEGLGGFLGIFTGGAGSAQSAGAQVGNSAVSGMDTLASNAATKGVNGVLALAKGLSSGSSNVNKSSAALNTTAVKAVEVMSKNMTKVANNATKGMISALRAGVGQTRSAGASLASAAKSGASGHSLYNTGSNLASGFARGISGGAYKAINAAANMAAAAIRAARHKAEVKSPSRVFMRIGNYVAEGFAIGIRQGTGEAAKAGADLAGSIPDAFGNVLDNLSIDIEDILDTDYSPEITPVINATSFDSGIGRLRTALGTSFNDLSVGNLNYTGELSAKISDANDLNQQMVDAMSNNAIDYGRLGVSVANALIQSGVHVEIDGGQLMGYLAGEIKDVRRMYG